MENMADEEGPTPDGVAQDSSVQGAEGRARRGTPEPSDMIGLVLGGDAVWVLGLGIVLREIKQDRKDAKDVLIPGEVPVNHEIDFKDAVSLETRQTMADMTRLQDWLSDWEGRVVNAVSPLGFLGGSTDSFDRLSAGRTSRSRPIKSALPIRPYPPTSSPSTTLAVAALLMRLGSGARHPTIAQC